MAKRAKNSCTYARMPEMYDLRLRIRNSTWLHVKIRRHRDAAWRKKWNTATANVSCVRYTPPSSIFWFVCTFHMNVWRVVIKMVRSACIYRTDFSVRSSSCSFSLPLAHTDCIHFLRLTWNGVLVYCVSLFTTYHRITWNFRQTKKTVNWKKETFYICFRKVILLLLLLAAFGVACLPCARSRDSRKGHISCIMHNAM